MHRRKKEGVDRVERLNESEPLNLIPPFTGLLGLPAKNPKNPYCFLTPHYLFLFFLFTKNDSDF